MLIRCERPRRYFPSFSQVDEHVNDFLRSIEQQMIVEDRAKYEQERQEFEAAIAETYLREV